MWIKTCLCVAGGLIFMTGAQAQIVSAEKEDAASEYVRVAQVLPPAAPAEEEDLTPALESLVAALTSPMPMPSPKGAPPAAVAPKALAAKPAAVADAGAPTTAPVGAPPAEPPPAAPQPERVWYKPWTWFN